ncbi:MAG: Mth938-like domain-containing protein [bacterium]
MSARKLARSAPCATCGSMIYRLKIHHEHSINMKIHRDNPGNVNVIDKYEQGSLIVGGKAYEHCIAVMPSELRSLPELVAPEDIVFEALDFLLEAKPEVVLVGTGPALVFPDFSLIKTFHQRGTGCDIMDSPAACRTYNILVAEGRNVAAVILSP